MQYSVQDLLLVRCRRSLTQRVQHRQIMWSPASQHSKWRQFKEDAARIIESTAQGDSDKRLQMITKLIVSFATVRLGVEVGKTTKPNYSINQRADKINQELRTLAKQFKGATEAEKPPLAKFRNIIRKKLMNLCSGDE